MTSGSSDSRDTQRVYPILAAAALLTLAVGTVVYHFLEGWSWVDSFYFCTVAVTTVGFGDIAPTSDAAKLFTVAYIVTGIAIVGTFLDARLKRHGAARATRRARWRESKKDE